MRHRSPKQERLGGELDSKLNLKRKAHISQIRGKWWEAFQNIPEHPGPWGWPVSSREAASLTVSSTRGTYSQGPPASANHSTGRRCQGLSSPGTTQLLHCPPHGRPSFCPGSLGHSHIIPVGLSAPEHPRSSLNSGPLQSLFSL